MLQAGETIVGKWTKQVIRVKKRLGSGANGEVYLVAMNHGFYAMKVCDKAGDIALEWSVIDKLHQVTRCFPQPFLIDDIVPKNLYFYVMERIEGVPLHDVFARLRTNDMQCLMQGVIQGLIDLHATQHAFCDLKPENILVQEIQGLRIRFVDVGGVTPFGRSVRQFTPYFDRAFWGLGTRVADEKYDLMAFALMLVCLTTPPPKQLHRMREQERLKWLYQSIAQFPVKQYQVLLEDILRGKIGSAKEVLRKLSETSLLTTRSKRKTRTSSGNVKLHSSKNGRRTVKQSGDWTERLMWWSLGSATLLTFVAWASFLGWF